MNLLHSSFGTTKLNTVRELCGSFLLAHRHHVSECLVERCRLDRAHLVGSWVTDSSLRILGSNASWPYSHLQSSLLFLVKGCEPHSLLDPRFRTTYQLDDACEDWSMLVDKHTHFWTFSNGGKSALSDNIFAYLCALLPIVKRT